jgi:hypothetical protein
LAKRTFAKPVVASTRAPSIVSNGAERRVRG